MSTVKLNDQSLYISTDSFPEVKCYGFFKSKCNRLPENLAWWFQGCMPKDKNCEEILIKFRKEFVRIKEILENYEQELGKLPHTK